MNIIDNDLLSIQEARILIEHAKEAQSLLSSFSQEKLDEVVREIAKEIEKHSNELAFISQNETDYGNASDKCIKNKFVSSYVFEKIKDIKCIGIISEDTQNKTMDIGVPVGVIVALIPSTSPVSTAIYKTLIAIKSGNAIVFSPHKRAKKSVGRALDIMIKKGLEFGLPQGSLSYLKTVTEAGTKEMMNHKDTSIIMNTGVLEMLSEGQKSGKPVIYGGNGCVPAFIERTANIKDAVRDIIKSKTFDNGVLSGSEQSVVVDSPVAMQVQNEMENLGAYFMTEKESMMIGNILFDSTGNQEVETIGKTALDLAKRAGISVPENTKVLVSKQKYVFENNPYSKEKLCPVLAYYIEEDWMNACEKCIELLLSERNGHTLSIHSNDQEVIKQFALKKPVGRILVNTPGAFGSMGITTNLFPAMTLGSGSAGKGMTSDNISPMNLVYIRKVGVGVRSLEDITKDNSINKAVHETKAINSENIDHEDGLKEILEKILREIN